MEISEDIAIKVSNISKSFKLPHERQNSIKSALINFNKRGYEEQKVLSDISFEIKKGDFFGIVGRNGSGKSTLLKLIAGIYSPDKGDIGVNGNLTPFIELGVGFNPELSGRENVYLNGALLGFNRKDMDAMYDDIVKFAELERFMDQKLKNYSSGMQVRLAFSIAIRSDSDILLLDEVLAVGDEAFQQKCYTYFGDLKKNNKTVILVTHDMGAVEKYCNKAILIEKGEININGTNTEVASAYRELFIRGVGQGKLPGKQVKDQRVVTSVGAEVLQRGKPVNNIKPFEPFALRFSFTAKENLGEAALGFTILNSMGNNILSAGIGTIYDQQFTIHEGKNMVEFTVRENLYTQDSYVVNMAIALGPQDGYQELVYQASGLVPFSILGVNVRPHSLTHPKISITIK
jgi:ABC-2 type transport system ATP-binding protein